MFSPIAFSEASTAPQVRVVGGPGPLFPQKLARTAGGLVGYVLFFIAVHAISYEIISQMK
jgi:hypothetical protein